MRRVLPLLLLAACWVPGTAAVSVLAEGGEPACGGDPTESVVNDESVPGELQVTHYAYTWDCCPATDPRAVADHATHTITVAYGFEPGDCDCICPIELDYTLAPLTPGAWTLDIEGVSYPATVQ